MKKIILSATLLAGIMAVSAQDCKTYFISREGATAEYNRYDAKHKLTGRNIVKIAGKTAIPGGVQLNVENTSFDKNNEELMKSEFVVKCENGVFTFEMDNYFTPQGEVDDNNAFQVTGDNLDIPANPTVGQMLKDGSVTISMPANPVFNMSIKINNRKVEAIEPVTTPAGTFECVKISYDVESKMMFVIKTKGTEWHAADVGLVKSESYDAKGKLSGSQELVKLAK